MKWLGVVLAFAGIAFALWHGPGILTAMSAVPAALSRGAVEQLKVPLRVRAAAGDPEIRIDLRAFVPADWKRRNATEKLPALLYMPGWGGRATDNDVLLRRISADGYLVFAIDDVATDAPGPGESDEMIAARSAPFDLSSPAGIDNFVRVSDRKVELAVAKISLVLDGILAVDSTEFHELLARVDPARIGTLGFSFGGAVATEALKRNSRIRAAINLDGWVYGRFAAGKVDKPYLMMGSTNSMPVAGLGVARRNVIAMNDQHLARIRPQLELPDSRFVEIPGTLHGDFSDGLHGPDRWTQWRPWSLPLADPTVVRATIDSTVLGFLAKHVKAARLARLPATGTTERMLPRARNG